jgi:hypothetical protein
MVVHVIDVPLVLHGVVAAAVAMLVRVTGVLRVGGRALVPVTFVLGVCVALVNEVGVALVHDGRMAAVGAVLVGVLGVYGMLVSHR